VEQPTSAPAKYRFGAFELDREAAQLRKRGIRVKLQEQPYRILCLLLDNPGEVVARETLCSALWPDGTFVEFERSLNAGVAKLRQALGDSAENPRFVETVARRGYRFIAPVELDLDTTVPPANSTPAPNSAAIAPLPKFGPASLRIGWFAVSIAAIILASGIALLALRTTTSRLSLQTEAGLCFDPNAMAVGSTWFRL
jgi:DNA-binding winged helix-turn-helix (wHTH) protein